MKTWTIRGKYEGCPVDTVDQADTRTEAYRLLREYAMAFGKGWTLWIVPPAKPRRRKAWKPQKPFGTRP